VRVLQYVSTTDNTHLQQGWVAQHASSQLGKVGHNPVSSIFLPPRGFFQLPGNGDWRRFFFFVASGAWAGAVSQATFDTLPVLS
jgi:hypothetical protein